MTIVSKNLTSKVIKLFKGEGDAVAKIRGDQDKAIQAVLDAMTLACDKPKAEFMKGNAKSNDARREVKEMFDAIVSPTCSASSAASYQTAFWIAFERGIPFQRDLNNKKSSANDTPAKPATPKSGKVETTTMEDMHKTLSKALAQGRMLNQLVFVPALLDFIVDHYPDFKETVLSK